MLRRGRALCSASAASHLTNNRDVAAALKRQGHEVTLDVNRVSSS
jgi:hypothetical protein